MIWGLGMKVNDVYDKLVEHQGQIAEDIGEIKVTLARQEESLRHHIRRTELAEEAISLNRKHLDIAIEKLNKDFEPVKSHVQLINSGFKIVGGVSVLVSIIAGIVKIFGFLV